MAASTAPQLVSFDYDSNRANLVAFLRARPELSDYDFAGSTISQLLDLLAYNDWLMAFSTNMTIAEAFQDSAQLLSSVVSRAKAQGYVPRSFSSSEALVTLTFPQSNLSSLTIPGRTRFSSINSNGSFTFTTTSSLVAYPSASGFVFSDIVLREGTWVSDGFVVDHSVDNQVFRLTNAGIDTDSLVVSVSNTAYTRADSLYGLGSTSNAYFLQASLSGGYEFLFGDGVVGYSPPSASVVSAQYRISSGTDADGCSSFQLIDNIGPANGLSGAIVPAVVSTTSGAGANSEGIESIRFRAPRWFETQDRAVTKTDTETLVLRQFQNIRSCRAYDGSELDLPQYGFRYVSAVTRTGEPLSTLQKLDVVDYVGARSMLGIRMEDPDFLYINVSARVTYDPSKTSLSAAGVEAAAKAAISAYSLATLSTFGAAFRDSDFDDVVDEAEPSIVSNTREITLQRIVTPQVDSPSSFSISLMNPIVPGSVQSTKFLTPAGRIVNITDVDPNKTEFTLQQDNGTVRINRTSNVLFLLDSTSPATSGYSSIGNIDYSTGLVSVTNLSVHDFMGSRGIEIRAKPVISDVMASRNSILEIDQVDVSAAPIVV